MNAVISTNKSTEFITDHVIYNPAYTYKFQLKTTIVIGTNWIATEIKRSKTVAIGSAVSSFFNARFHLVKPTHTSYGLGNK